MPDGRPEEETSLEEPENVTSAEDTNQQDEDGTKGNGGDTFPELPR